MADGAPKLVKTPAPQQGPTTIEVPGKKEIATLEVEGTRHTDWTSIQVSQEVAEWFPRFTFETTEATPMPLQRPELQFQPGDVVRVYLGDVQVVFGYITERHVAYDARQHGVRLTGVGDTFDLTTSSVPPEVWEGNDGKGWTAIAERLIAHLNIQIGHIGTVDEEVFQKAGIQPGETISTALERLARMRNIVIGSNPNGGLLAIGENAAAEAGQLIEGNNILRANAVIRDTHLYKRILSVASDTGGSSGSTGGAASNQQKFELPGTHRRPRVVVAVCELADTPHGVERRCHMERVFTEGSEIEANITVQGWFKNNNESNQVWRAGEYYFVNAPMLMLPGVLLGCAKCVYEQNNQGTTTTLQMVKPEHMNGLLNYRDSVLNFLRIQQGRKSRPGVPVFPSEP